MTPTQIVFDRIWCYFKVKTVIYFLPWNLSNSSTIQEKDYPSRHLIFSPQDLISSELYLDYHYLNNIWISFNLFDWRSFTQSFAGDWCQHSFPPLCNIANFLASLYFITIFYYWINYKTNLLQKTIIADINI